MRKSLPGFFLPVVAALVLLVVCAGCITGLPGVSNGLGSSPASGTSSGVKSGMQVEGQGSTNPQATSSSTGNQAPVYTCPDHPEMTACDDGYCYDLAQNHDHCGACSNTCAGFQDCVQGQCVSGAGTKAAACKGVTVDLNSDNGNCGQCGYHCNSLQTCISGKCVETTPETGTTQASVPPDPCTGVTNCISCYSPTANVYTVCAPGQMCSGGACIASSSGGTTPTPTTTNIVYQPHVTLDPCADMKGLTNCDGGCFNLKTDASHCGSCTNACPAGQTCSKGACVQATPSWGGSWIGHITYDFDMSLTVNTDTTVTGTYASGQGSLSGIVSTDGKVINAQARWKGGTPMPCQFTMNADGVSFTGYYTDGSGQHAWTGHR